MRQKIELSKEGREKIAKTFDVTLQNVSQALNFKRNSPTSIKIREMALELGGTLFKQAEVDRSVRILNQKGEPVRKI